MRLERSMSFTRKATNRQRIPIHRLPKSKTVESPCKSGSILLSIVLLEISI